MKKLFIIAMLAILPVCAPGQSVAEEKSHIAHCECTGMWYSQFFGCGNGGTGGSRGDSRDIDEKLYLGNFLKGKYYTFYFTRANNGCVGNASCGIGDYDTGWTCYRKK